MRYTNAYTTGPTNATRRLESLSSDPQVHMREHHAGILATATATAANTAADAKSLRGTEEGRREGCDGERDAVPCRAAAPVGEIGSTWCTIEAALIGGDAAKLSLRLPRVDLVIDTTISQEVHVYEQDALNETIAFHSEQCDPEANNDDARPFPIAMTSPYGSRRYSADINLIVGNKSRSVGHFLPSANVVGHSLSKTYVTVSLSKTSL